VAGAAAHVDAIAAAAQEVARSGWAQQRATEASAAAKIGVDTFDARVLALTNRDAYKDHEKLALRRSQLEKEERGLAQEQARLAKARANFAELAQGAEVVAGTLASVGRAIDRPPPSSPPAPHSADPTPC